MPSSRRAWQGATMEPIATARAAGDKVAQVSACGAAEPQAVARVAVGVRVAGPCCISVADEERVAPDESLLLDLEVQTRDHRVITLGTPTTHRRVKKSPQGQSRRSSARRR